MRLETIGHRVVWTAATLVGISAAVGVSERPGDGYGDGDDDQSALQLMTKRRVRDVAQFPDPSWFPQISGWLASQKQDGTWSDVDYTSGCPAQRANWPIQQHWNRLIAFGAAWSGSNPDIPANWTGDAHLFQAISRGLDYWFDNDYTEPDCVGDGGVAGHHCPCGTPGLWNTNWYDQGILIPQLCSSVCLLVKDGNLTESQRAGCERIPKRAYDLRDESIGTGGYMTGSNLVLLMENSVSLALFLGNSSILEDSMNRAMGVMTFAETAKEDGIHRDGSFLQHKGILYSGNYGKDLLNAFIQLEGEATGTPYAAKDETRDAMSTFIRGNEWMIFTDRETKMEHWDINAIGRFVAFPSVDLQANADINFNTSKLAAAVDDFAGRYNLSDTIRRLRSNGTEKLIGNKGFWASDLMIHRRNNFILTNKMLSQRSTNSECVNSANPYGYHLGQGTLFSYVEGNEYKDMMDAWDWNLVPGTTVLLDKPKLEAATVNHSGKTDFVGVVSDGQFGASVEDYIDPLDGSIAYRKSWFFVDEGVIVITTDVKTNKTNKSPVVTVLDNRAAVGSNNNAILVDGKPVRTNTHLTKDMKAKTLFYGGNGYLAYDDSFHLTLSLGKRSGNWSEISTSTVGVTSADIFSAYTTIPHDHFTYGVFPATTQNKLTKEAHNPTWKPIIKDGISGIYGPDRLGLAFWPSSSSSSSSSQQDKYKSHGMSIELDLCTLGWANSGTLIFHSHDSALYLFHVEEKSHKGLRLTIIVADPTQKLKQVSFSTEFKGGMQFRPITWPGKAGFEILATHAYKVMDWNVSLDDGGYAGSSKLAAMMVEF